MEFSNPFDNPQGLFFILCNAQQQYCLWPQQCALPIGWQVACNAQPQADCNTWLNAQWQSLHPRHQVSCEGESA
ncbi:invasin [Mangrovibacter phragmitis]|uniref:Invasin n=1 Tax=Mangrovibacter phragmitis TaxID=1691903 RepID=A0A1B7KYB8_9ENTR|nr:MbtH family NRPS accessory protein [Mangrovibacter phragmitis]OAT75130.1 invasin [Mangrovibacter phragmitis]